MTAITPTALSLRLRPVTTPPKANHNQRIIGVKSHEKAAEQNNGFHKMLVGFVCVCTGNMIAVYHFWPQLQRATQPSWLVVWMWAIFLSAAFHTLGVLPAEQWLEISWLPPMMEDNKTRTPPTECADLMASATHSNKMVKSDQKLEKITILCLGSRGDIQPYLVVALALQKRGYQVRFLTHECFVAFAQSFGLTSVAVAGDFEKTMREMPELRRAMAQGSTLAAAQGLGLAARRDAPRLCAAVLQDLEDHRPDLILVNTLGYYFGWFSALNLSIPFIQLAMQDLVYNPNHMMLGLPTLPFGLHYILLYYGLLPNVYKMFTPYDDCVGRKRSVSRRISLSRFRQETLDPRMPMLVMTSPLFAEKLFPNAPQAHKYVGTTVMDSQQQINHPSFGGHIQRFQDFLDQGPAVYIGWGSMICQSPMHMVLTAVRAVRHAGVRAILLGGFARLSLTLLESADVPDREELVAFARQHVLWADTAPHEWLFPRVMCTVHHGGSGTTTAALRAGVPTIITPVLLDQYDFSYVVRELGVGVGFSKPLPKISWQELGQAIYRACTDHAMQDRAAEVGKELRSEQGGETAVETIEGMWTEFMQSGKFDDALHRVADLSSG